MAAARLAASQVQAVSGSMRESASAAANQEKQRHEQQARKTA
jgi:hypothetical protein